MIGMSSRGGYREGSGRKRLEEPKIRISLRLSQEAYQKIEKFAAEHQISRNEVVERSLKKTLSL